MTPTAEPTITIRTATEADMPALDRLAALDDTARIYLPALVAEQDGVPVATLSLADGLIAADPFVRTAETVELLELRASRLRAETPRRRGIIRARRGRRAVAARA